MTQHTEVSENPTNGVASTAVAVRDAKDPDRSIAAFSSQGNFEAAQRMAKALSSSSLVPKDYQGNLPNTLIAMELASRVGASVFMVMQNLDIIHGRPSWRSQFLIATVNACGRFTPIRYDFQGDPGDKDWGCRAVAKDRETGEECVGPLVTMEMASAEGWATKNGSKWKTLPELMLCYRAATFWTRSYAPELSMGMHTADEVEDAGMHPGPSAQADDLGSALQEVVQNAKVVEAEVETGELASDELLDSLGELMEKARAADVMTMDLEEQVQAALQTTTKADVTEVKKALSKALLEAEGGQGDMLDGED